MFFQKFVHPFKVCMLGSSKFYIQACLHLYVTPVPQFLPILKLQFNAV